MTSISLSQKDDHTPMDTKNLYNQSHLVVAMVRILEHRKKTPPTLADVADGLGYSLEQTQFVCHKLKEKGIVDMVEDAYALRLFIRDHTRIETIEQAPREDAMKKAMEAFQTRQKGLSERIEKIHASQQAKQNKLFSQLEAMLKKPSTPQKPDSAPAPPKCGDSQ